MVPFGMAGFFAAVASAKLPPPSAGPYESDRVTGFGGSEATEDQ